MRESTMMLWRRWKSVRRLTRRLEQRFEKVFSCAIEKNEFLFGCASGKQIFGYEHIE